MKSIHVHENTPKLIFSKLSPNPNTSLVGEWVGFIPISSSTHTASLPEYYFLALIDYNCQKQNGLAIHIDIRKLFKLPPRLKYIL